MDLTKFSFACIYLFFILSFGAGQDPPLHTIALSLNLFLSRLYYFLNLCGPLLDVVLYRYPRFSLPAEYFVEKL